MNKCSDNRYEKMLHAFELGLLNEDECKELEIHLLDCESCFNKAISMENATRLINIDSDVKESILLDHIKENNAYREDVGIWEGLKRSKLTLVVTVAVLIVFLILRPWRIDISPGQDAHAANNKLLVMSFENMVDNSDTGRLGDIIANLLSTDLAQSSYFQIISNQRIYDVLKKKGLDYDQRYKHEIVNQIADELGTRWILTGAILQTKPNLVLTVRMTDVITGEIVSSQKMTGNENESVFESVDNLVSELRYSLDLPGFTPDETDIEVSALTTTYPEAYDSYLLGVEAENKLLIEDAVTHFRKAIEIDSTFAMAYYHLAKHVAHDATLIYISKAEMFGKNLGEKEKRLIASLKYNAIGQYQKSLEQLYILASKYSDDKEVLSLLASIEYSIGMMELATIRLEKIIRMDPSYKIAYNILAYTYGNLGDRDKAFDNANKYIALAPDEPNPYDTKGDIHKFFNEVDSAIIAYNKALEIAPEFPTALYSLSRIYLCQEEYENARAFLNSLAESPHMKNNHVGILADAIINIRRGKYSDALENINMIMSSELLENDKQLKSNILCLANLLKGKVLKGQGKYKQAIAAQDKSLEFYNHYVPALGTKGLFFGVQLLAEMGQIERANQGIQNITKYGPAHLSDPGYLYSLGLIEFYKGNFESAKDYFSQSISDKYDFIAHYMLGRTYLKTNQYEKAIEVFKGLSWINTTWDYSAIILDVIIYYYLAVAYEKNGDHELAAENYKKFIDILKDADNNLVEVNDARDRLGKLQEIL